MQSCDVRFSPNIVEQTRAEYKAKKAKHRKLIRKTLMNDNIKRDATVHSVLSNDPSKIFQAVRSIRKTSNTQIKKLYVHDKLYEDDKVCDGFYDSISFLKTSSHQDLENCDNFNQAGEEYTNILRICRNKSKIPKISLEMTRKILHSIRPAVSDYASITAYHYRYAGEAGLLHLYLLINGLIDDVNNMSVDELNTVTANILHKGHGKAKDLADNYRTISTCPFLSKVLDTYIDEVYGHIWEHHQAITQFQGK